jgi:hypothetical protein
MYEEAVNVKTMLARQALQPHQGMILTDKDARTLQSNNQFKSVELNEKFLNVTLQGASENLDSSTANQSAIMERRMSDAQQMVSSAHFETKRMNETALNAAKEQRLISVIKETQ